MPNTNPIWNASQLQGVSISSTSPTTDQLLQYNGTSWAPWTPNYLPSSNISGTTNYVAKFTGVNSLGNSQIFDNGTYVGIGTTTPQANLDVNGNFKLGQQGTVLNNIVSISNVQISDSTRFWGNHYVPVTLPLPNGFSLSNNATIIINPMNRLDHLSIGYVRVTGTNQIEVQFVNTDYNINMLGLFVPINHSLNTQSFNITIIQ